jgi:hypothetical protein
MVRLGKLYCSQSTPLYRRGSGCLQNTMSGRRLASRPTLGCRRQNRFYQSSPHTAKVPVRLREGAIKKGQALVTACPNIIKFSVLYRHSFAFGIRLEIGKTRRELTVLRHSCAFQDSVLVAIEKRRNHVFQEHLTKSFASIFWKFAW